MTIKQKQLILAYFDCLPVSGVDGIWGPQSEGATRKLQKLLDITEDGDFGLVTEVTALNTMASGKIPTVSEKETAAEDSTAAEDWWEEIEYFGPPEFACKCGRYCNGYPHEIQPLLVQILDRARKHFSQPIIIVSGLRCQQHNANVGGVSNSQHMFGEAADVYVYGVSQQTVLAWFLNQPDVRYAYAIEDSNNVHFDIQKVGR